MKTSDKKENMAENKKETKRLNLNDKKSEQGDNE